MKNENIIYSPCRFILELAEEHRRRQAIANLKREHKRELNNKRITVSNDTQEGKR